jgi:hypothetical protein
MPYTYQKNAAGLYVCEHCGITKERQNTMHYHLKKHEGHLPFQCTHCNKEFLQASTLALHIAARHPNATPTASTATDAPPPSFGCPCCNHTTLTKANAVLHYLRTHCAEEVKSFQGIGNDAITHSLTCAACEKVCKSATAYLYHVASANCIARALPLEKQDALKGMLAGPRVPTQLIHLP